MSRLQLRAGEQDGVGRVGREVLDKPGAEPEVLAQVDPPESPRVSVPDRSIALDHGVRVGGDREDRRDAELARDIGGREAAHIGHPQVQQVDRSRGPQDATDAAPGGDAQRPGRGRGHRIAQQRHAAVYVSRTSRRRSPAGPPRPGPPDRARG